MRVTVSRECEESFVTGASSRVALDVRIRIDFPGVRGLVSELRAKL